MRFISFLFLLSSSVGFAQNDVHTTICFGVRNTEEAARISETPKKLDVRDLNSSEEDSIKLKKRNQLIISIPNSNFIYAGYANLIHISLNKRTMRKIALECTGCDTLYQITSDNNSQWAIRANNTSKVIIRAVNQKAKVLSEVELPVLGIPQPNVFLDGLNAQSTLRSLPEQMRVRFNSNIPLTANFPVNRWEILINDNERFAGFGSAIPQIVRDYMKSVKRGTIRIDVSYFTQNGKESVREIFAFLLQD
jgi:hypothetical protein